MNNYGEIISKVKEKILANEHVAKLKSNPSFEAQLDKIFFKIPQDAIYYQIEEPEDKTFGDAIIIKWDRRAEYKDNLVSGDITFKLNEYGLDANFYNDDIRSTENEHTFSTNYRTCDTCTIKTNPNNDGMIVQEGSTMIASKNPAARGVNVYKAQSESIFWEDGIQMSYENEVFKPYVNDVTTFESYGRVSNGFAPIDLSSSSNVSQEIRMRRQGLDTAWLYAFDNERGTEYRTSFRLNWEHGLREMRVPGDMINSCPDEVIIPEMSKEEIQALIDKEPDPRVKEGLIALAQGRENYHYYSKEDPNFSRKGFEERGM